MLPETIKAPYTLPRILQTLTIRTDDAFPDDLATVGGMLDVLRRPTWRRLVPIKELRCATLKAPIWLVGAISELSPLVGCSDMRLLTSPRRIPSNVGVAPSSPPSHATANNLLFGCG